MKLVLIRTFQNEKKTLGDMYIYDNAGHELKTIKTLELPWDGNKVRKSCIPEGTYTAKVHQSPKFGWSLWLQNVPGRTAILIHQGNYTRQILGCILVGLAHVDIDKDDITDVVSSKLAMGILKGVLKDETEVEIKIINAAVAGDKVG